MKKIVDHLRTVSVKARVRLNKASLKKYMRRLDLSAINQAKKAAARGALYVMVKVPDYPFFPGSDLENIKEHFKSKGFGVEVFRYSENEGTTTTKTFLKLVWLHIRPLLGS